MASEECVVNIRLLLATLVLVGCTPAPEPVVEEVPVPVEMQGEWTTGAAQGFLEHMIVRTETNGVNVRSYLDIACYAWGPEGVDYSIIDYDGGLFGPDWYDVGISVQFDNRDVEGAFLIIDDYTEFDIDWVLQDCRVCVNNYYAMWEALRNAQKIAIRSPEGVVKEFPVTGMKETLPEEPCTHISEIAYQ